MERSDITSKLKDLIEDQENIKIGSDDEELDIDSFTMMLIITFVKEDLDVQLDMDRLDFDAFASLNTFANIVLETANAQT